MYFWFQLVANTKCDSSSLTGLVVTVDCSYCSTVSAISFFFAHSGQMMSSPSVMNPLPTWPGVGDRTGGRYPHHARLAGTADEAVVVPVPALERDEARAPDA